MCARGSLYRPLHLAALHAGIYTICSFAQLSNLNFFRLPIVFAKISLNDHPGKAPRRGAVMLKKRKKGETERKEKEKKEKKERKCFVKISLNLLKF